MYVYCKREPDGIVNLWGFAIKTSNLPWVLLGLGVITGQNILQNLAGYAVGHLYDFLKYILPDTFGYNILETPNWFKSVVDFIHSMVTTVKDRAPQPQTNNVRNLNNDAGEEFNNAPRFRAFRGPGMRLGGD